MLGFNGPSILSSIPHFGIVDGMLFDNLHALHLGLTRQMMHLLLDSIHHEETWYIETSADRDQITDPLTVADSAD